MASLIVAEIAHAAGADGGGGGAAHRHGGGGGGSDGDGVATARHYLCHGTLSVAAAAVAVLFAVGVAVYMVVEGLTLVDAAYLTTGVITTVGLVIVPRTVVGRAFTAIFNILSLGIGVLLLTEIADGRRSWHRGLLRRFITTPTPLGLEIAALLAASLPAIVGAAVFFHVVEGWPMGESFYFCLITASGLGMGDVEPRQWPSRLVFVIYLWMTMGVTLGLLGSLGHVAHEALHGGLWQWIGGQRSPDKATSHPHREPGDVAAAAAAAPAPTTGGRVLIERPSAAAPDDSEAAPAAHRHEEDSDETGELVSVPVVRGGSSIGVLGTPARQGRGAGTAGRGARTGGRSGSAAGWPTSDDGTDAATRAALEGVSAAAAR